jgi:hypothetical protein
MDSVIPTSVHNYVSSTDTVIIVVLSLVIFILTLAWYFVDKNCGERRYATKYREFFNGESEGVEENRPVRRTIVTTTTTKTTKQNSVNPTETINELARKYFSTTYVRAEDCDVNPNAAPVNPDMGNIRKFLSMQGKVFKMTGVIYNVDRPNFEDYVMLDNFNLENGTARYYRSSINLTTGRKNITTRCINLDFRDPDKLVDSKGTLTINYIKNYDWFTVADNGNRAWIIQEQTE